MFSDIRKFVELDDAAPPTYMGFGIPVPPPEYQVLHNMPHNVFSHGGEQQINSYLSKFVNLEICLQQKQQEQKKSHVFSGIIN